MYVITAHIIQTVDGWLSVIHVPTFALSADLLGIVSEEHAAEIAREVINPLGGDVDIHVTATKY